MTGVGASSIKSSGETRVEQRLRGDRRRRLLGLGAPRLPGAAAQPQSAVSCGAAATTCREVPDVTANGDPNTGYVIYYDGQWNTMGGTSISTPTWAALAALADSSPACAGHPVGFANPALYKLAASAYGANFGDVTSGANGYEHVAGFAAGPGYDMASGLGTPNARSLVPALCGGAPIAPAPSPRRPRRRPPPPAPGPAASPSAALGARSSPLGTRVTVRLRARDGHGLALRYAATGLPRGLTINPRTGVIVGRARHAGTRTVTIRVSDSRGGFARASFRWRVRAAAHHRSA